MASTELQLCKLICRRIGMGDNKLISISSTERALSFGGEAYKPKNVLKSDKRQTNNYNYYEAHLYTHIYSVNKN